MNDPAPEDTVPEKHVPDVSAPEAKSTLRRAALARRRALSEAERARGVVRLLGSVDHLPIPDGATVSGFWPIRGEIDPLPLMRVLRERGCRLCLPAVIDATTIVFREWLNDDDLVETGFGTMGPDATAGIVDPDVLLVPVAVFDRSGGRIGYGAGYYDRAIEKLHDKGLAPALIGIAFSCQETAEVPVEAHDQPLDLIATELDIIACRQV